MTRTDGFLLVDKPVGWTSHGVVAKVRSLFDHPKVGHAGTLDPPATGLLVLGMGRCTRLLRFIQELPKTYRAEVVFGVATDTLDASGAILTREPMPISEEDLSRVAERFVGIIYQTPPMMSAVRIGGRRLYELARMGQEIDRPARRVRVDRLVVEEFSPGDYPEATLLVVCGTGTYVRTLADDLARCLGGRAHLAALRRVSIGSLVVEHAQSMAALEEIDREGRERLIVAPADGLADLPEWSPEPGALEGIRHGMSFPASVLGDRAGAELLRVLDAGGRLVAIYARRGGGLQAEVVLE